ncbi:unnamed protein product [Blepharisma stoltei]|uniref:RRM domain-containing protein n=1 Tax=Blepharisma stoltei TaxID=1481888 RepID=A0AAU9JF90_9CILI|nr:unnamed protein product [Blepharisma stoltei]
MCQAQQIIYKIIVQNMVFLFQAKNYRTLKSLLRQHTFFKFPFPRFFSSNSDSLPKDGSNVEWDLNNVIMVWNTPYTAHEWDILRFFKQCGEPKLAKNWTANKSNTLIQFQNESEVNKALALNRTEFMGRPLFIKKIEGKEENKTILAWNIPKILELNKLKLKEFFEDYGTVVDIRLNRNYKKEFLGKAFIEFKSTEDALNAFKLHNKKFLGKNIQLTTAINKPPR